MTDRNILVYAETGRYRLCFCSPQQQRREKRHMKKADLILLKSNGKEIELYCSSQGGPLVIYHAVKGEGASLWNACMEQNCPAFSLAVINRVAWNDEMTPWPIPPISRKDMPCTGGADSYLPKLVHEMLPKICGELPAQPDYCALAGYSLAGLFAVYAAFQTACFERIASASGSLWYPDFIPFVQSHKVSEQTKFMYFSLGDRERHTKNSCLASVEHNTLQLVEHFSSCGITTSFQMVPGNHFQNAIGRIADGIRWMLSQRCV